MKILFILFTLSNLLTLSAFAARPVRGVYEVPTTDELKPFAKYPVRFDGIDYEDKPTKFNFPLPIELTGVSQTIEMNASPTHPTQWAGAQVAGECNVVGRNLECKMKFNNLAFDPAAAEAIIRAKFSPNEIDGRLQLMRQFGGEPIGILSYELRGGDRERK